MKDMAEMEKDMENMELEAEEVSYSYDSDRKKQAVLEVVSFAVSSGERVGLRGVSGRGKTTLCRLLAGFTRPSAGSVRLNGKDIREYRGYCPVQLIWQHPEQAVNPRFRIRRVLAEAGMEASPLAEAFGIRPEWMDRFPSELSGGELQRICLVRALRPETRFLLADEITAMLDLVTQEEIWNALLREAEARRLGMVVVSHSDALLRRVCTRIVEL